jgi:hypothetical protein
LLAVADWWLGRARAVEFDMEAAATPAKTTEKAKMRMASFMIGNPFLVLDSWKKYISALLQSSV